MIHRIFFSCLRTYTSLVLQVYFRRIAVEGRGSIPPGPVVFAANHQNAFLDALLIVCTAGRYTHFLARADIFKKKWARWLLNSINLIPVYRLRDGWQSLANNRDTFDRCRAVLLDQNPVVIFPEGNHNSERRLRPLSKGFARVAFEALRHSPEMPLFIVPVGLNYSAPSAARSCVRIVYGEPLPVGPFFRQGETAGAVALREALSQSLQQLITHLPTDRYAHVMKELTSRNADFLCPGKINQWVAGAAVDLPRREEGTDYLGLALRAVFFPAVWVWRRCDSRITDRVFTGSLKFGFTLAVVTFFIVLLLVALAFWVRASGM